MKLTLLKISLWCVTIGLFNAFIPKNTADQKVTLTQLLAQLDSTGTVYRAIADGDTAWLKLSNKGTAVQGKLQFKFANGTITAGLLKGTLRKGILSGDYLFKTEQGIWYRNPVSFLQAGPQLTMGVAEMEFAWGRAYFAKNAALDYDRGRFVFVKTKGPLVIK